MAEDGTERCWLVERDYAHEDLVTLVYATPDGEWMHQRQRATTMLLHDPATAAIEIDADELTPVEDDERRERYATEAQRMMDRKEPDDEV